MPYLGLRTAPYMNILGESSRIVIVVRIRRGIVTNEHQHESSIFLDPSRAHGGSLLLFGRGNKTAVSTLRTQNWKSLLESTVMKPSMTDKLQEAGLYIDDLNKLRIVDPAVTHDTNELKTECENYLSKNMNGRIYCIVPKLVHCVIFVLFEAVVIASPWLCSSSDLKAADAIRNVTALPAKCPPLIACVRLSNKPWLYGSETSVLNTDVMLPMMMKLKPKEYGKPFSSIGAIGTTERVRHRNRCMQIDKIFTRPIYNSTKSRNLVSVRIQTKKKTTTHLICDQGAALS
ncbi:intraflagellar transport protein 20 homolog [Clonorchis sinensis]|uniref:Intraflagellar transport protein 20 homolog n=1 Tax=Clonorchis sinensis TaxID=79923 RepID=G7YHT9_CLOSI|nr:intraflagellar transport protein 20 homolog [Clonorchis sinensis]